MPLDHAFNFRATNADMTDPYKHLACHRFRHWNFNQLQLLPTQMDGELTPPTPVTVKVIHRAIPVLLPPT
jgi:diacylglycerol kinase family enzyme